MKFVACYIRISSGGKSQAAQKRGINQWLKSKRIDPKSVRWYIYKASDGRRKSKLAALQKDILDNKVRAVVVWHLDRLAPSARDRLSVLIDWCQRSLRIVSVSQQVDIKPDDCKMIGAVLGGVTEVHEQTIRARAMPGIGKARARGRSGGRPRVVAEDPRVVKVKELDEAGQLSIDGICKQLNISRTTYYRYLEL